MKRCFRDPIPEIFEASYLLNRAVDEHLRDNKERASSLIKQADYPEIRQWTESIWGAKSPYVKVKSVSNPLPKLKKETRVVNRMPDRNLKQKLIDRDGFNCVFCGIPVIRIETRKKIQRIYSEELYWARKNIEQHAAFQAMWLQYDHLIPHSRGGNNDLNNLVITCAPCNFGRMELTLEETNLLNPFDRLRVKSDWDGLERFE